MQARSRILVTVVSLTGLLSGAAAQAKLGEDIGKYKEKVAKAYTFKGQTVKNGKTYDMFTINLTPQLKKVAPEFGGGLTITVDKGKIVGQSMVLQLGKSLMVTKTLAVRYALDFGFESLGHSVPKNPKEIADELNSYTRVIDNALADNPQNIRYPKLPGKLTVNKQSDGSLVLAATPN